MRKSLIIVSVLILVLVATVGAQYLWQSRGPGLVSPSANALRVATWNVHYIMARRDDGRWGLERWHQRKAPLAATFAALEADIVAFQEMETFEGSDDDTVNLARSWLLDTNPDYSAAAVGDWRVFPSTQPIFYRTERFDLLEQGWFFLSETPDVIYSRTFDGSYPAFVSWAVFRDRQNDAEFRVVNVHLDYSSGENRTRSVALMTDRMAPWIAGNEAVILAGDLNALAGSSLHDKLEQAGLTFVPVKGATYHLDRGLNLFGAIDHIAHTEKLQPIGEAMVVRERLDPVWPSDHYPVVVDYRGSGS